MKRTTDLAHSFSWLSAAIATCGILLAGAWGEPALAQTGFRVIVHPANAVDALAPETVSRLFLKKDKSWKEGLEVLPVDLSVDSPVRERFSEAVHGRGVSQIQRYWQQQLFSGSAVPPTELSSDAEVVEYVAANPGAIGYVSAGASLRGVKELSLDAEASPASNEGFAPLTPDMTPPRLVETVEPEYPLVARRARYECALTVRAVIDGKGKVLNVVVVEPCDRFEKQLNESALTAIRKWRFEPALDPQGQPTPVAYTFQVWFTL